MTHFSSIAPTVLAAFMASLVEFVEALTIILAVGVTRGWRSPLLGAGAALGLLIVLIAVLGRSLANIPLPVVQLVIGTLLLLFGLRWLRKAVLRSAGVIALHDEAEAFRTETAALGRHGAAARGRVDAIAFVTAFKAVLLEGVEVVFIVVAIGAGGGLLGPAAVGALLALLVVIGLGLALHRPLATLPENKLKFGVGVLLSAFGTFWVGEGIGLAWPGGDWAILVLTVLVAVVALALVPACVGRQRHAPKMPKSSAPSQPKRAVGPIRAGLAQAWKLFVDDGWLAIGIVAWVGVAWAAQSLGVLAEPVGRVLFTLGLMAMLAASALRRSRQ